MYESSSHAGRRPGVRIGWIAVVCMAFAACSALPTSSDPRVEDPCYSSTVWMDTVALVVDSVSWSWTPGMCD